MMTTERYIVLDKPLLANDTFDIIKAVGFSIDSIRPEHFSMRKSWSTDLARQLGGRWVTIRGNKVIIGSSPDGTGRILFSANPALEHLKIKPKGTPTGIQGGSGDANSNAKETPEITQEAKEKIKEAKSELSKVKKLVKSAKIKSISDILEKDTALKKALEDKTHQEKEQIVESISKKIVKDVQEAIVRDALGDSFSDVIPSVPPTFEDEKIQKLVENISLSDSEKLDLALKESEFKAQIKALNKQFKVNTKHPDKSEKYNLSSLSDLGLGGHVAVNDFIEKTISDVKNARRAVNNASFYEILNDRLYRVSKSNVSEKRVASRQLANSSINTLNTLNSLIGMQMSRGFMDFFGIENAAYVVANQIKTAETSAETQKDIDALLSQRAEVVVNETLKAFEKDYNNIQAIAKQSTEGTIASATSSAYQARVWGEISRKIANAAGSLEAAALVADFLRDKSEKRSITVFAGNNLDKIHKDLRKLGLPLESVNITEGANGYNIEIPPSVYSKAMQEKNSESFKRDETVAKLKDGSLVDPNYKVPGATDDFVPTKEQQEGIKFIAGDAENGVEGMKRGVLNFGAGLGKTLTYLGTISTLASQGKLDNNFAVMAVPSRLREAFFNDQKRFFPNLKVLNLDTIKGTKQKEEALRNAQKEGGYMVITGHDTVKNIETTDLLTSLKPAFLGIDEAHEVISTGGESARYKSMKKLAESSEYFVAGTGTPVRNTMKELAMMLHIARPDKIPDPMSVVKSYEGLSYGSSLLSDLENNEFSKMYDDIMLSREAELDKTIDDPDTGKKRKPRLKQNEYAIDITPAQKAEYALNEKQYRLDRDAKGKFGIAIEKTGRLEFESDNALKTFDTIEEANTYLKSKGKGYSIRELGKGASMRRDILHQKTLNAGNYKENAKIKKMLDVIKSAPPTDKHIIKYPTNLTYGDSSAKNTLVEALTKELGITASQIAFIDGSVDKNANLKKFTNDPNVRFMVMNSAGATGFNMQAASHVHSLSRDNTYAEQEQTVKRAYRNKQDKDVQAHFYDSNSTYDISKKNSIKRKKKLSDALGDYVENPNIRTYINEISQKGEPDSYSKEGLKDFLKKKGRQNIVDAIESSYTDNQE